MGLIMLVGGYCAWSAVSLLVADTLVGGGDPFSFLRDLRKRLSVPIIVHDRDADHRHGVEVVEAGADDYVNESCSCEELGLRARAILGRFRGDQAVASTSVQQ